jgi:hypothetical protein
MIVDPERFADPRVAKGPPMSKKTTIKARRVVVDRLGDIRRRFGFASIDELLETVARALEAGEAAGSRLPPPPNRIASTSVQRSSKARRS